jgi:hypothetical protein
MKPPIFSMLLILTVALLLSSTAFARAARGAWPAEHFSVREYEEFHHVLHPLEHEALPKGDFKTIRAQAKELVQRGNAILKLGAPAGVKKEHANEFDQGLKKFADALARFKIDAIEGTDAQLKESYMAVHDSFEMLAALLPPVKRGS